MSQIAESESKDLVPNGNYSNSSTASHSMTSTNNNSDNSDTNEQQANTTEKKPSQQQQQQQQQQNQQQEHSIGIEILQPGILKHLELDETPTNEDDVEKHCTPQTWTNVDATSFEVRRGPDYKPGSNQKAPSKKALYSVFAIDTYKAPLKVHKVSQFVDLTDKINEINKKGHGYDYDKWPLPPIVIINFMIPNYSPPVLGDKQDGDGFILVVYAEMTEDTRNHLEKLYKGEITKSELLPSIRLLSKFIHAAESRDSNRHFANKNVEKNEINRYGLTEKEINGMLDRFKVIVRVMNYSHTQLPYAIHPIVKNYNARPFLARTSSTFYHEPGRYFAVDIDAHVFGKLARRSLGYMKGVMETVIFDGGFVIEGRENDELPERVLCCARISKSGFNVARPFSKKLFSEYLKRKEKDSHTNVKHDINSQSMVNLKKFGKDNEKSTQDEAKSDFASKTVPVIDRNAVISANGIKHKNNNNKNTNDRRNDNSDSNNNSNDISSNSNGTMKSSMNGTHSNDAAT